MRLFFNLASVLMSIGVVSVPCPAAETHDWYYREGPLRGSLKSDNPLPLYDGDPEHLWNRLFAVFYIRPSELPSRPQYPDDATKLDEWDRQLRIGKLPAGPIVERIEGGDVLGILAWPKTRYFSEPSKFQRDADRLLDEFIETHGERLIDDPLRRAFFQRDLWAVFDHLVGQNISRFGDADLFRRRNTIPSHEIDTSRASRSRGRLAASKVDDRAAMQRRETLCRKLATIIMRLALPKSVIETLPDNYTVAIRSGRFSTRHDFDSSQDYLPRDLLSQPSEWLEIDTSPEPVHGDQREGQLTLIAWSIRGRSYYRVFWRFPDGPRAVEDYLDYLQREGVDWERSARQGYIALKPDVRQIPVGTEAAIIQFMVVLDDRLDPVPTRVVESVHLSVYKNVDGSPDPQTNTGRGLIASEYVVRRRLLFDDLTQGGLQRSADDAPTYRTLLNTSQDWGVFGRQQSVVQTCLHCHMYRNDKAGVFSMNSIFCHVPDRGMPGIVIPMGSGDIRTYSRAQRSARWKLGQEDYLRLVDYARADDKSERQERR